MNLKKMLCIMSFALAAASLSACSEEQVDEGGQIGDACDADNPCASGLICEDDVCVEDESAPPTGGQEGDTCSDEDPCASGLICEDDVCVKDDDNNNTGGQEGDACSDEDPCASGLVCEDDVCVDDDDNNTGGQEGDTCSDEDPCAGGLTCDEDMCCIDVNENGICDDVETEDDCENDQVFFNDLCCDDEDGDGLCDLDPADACVGFNNDTDNDNDGYCDDVDCDDDEAYVYPGAPEICGQQVINDCNNLCYDDGSCEDPEVFLAAKEHQVGEFDNATNVWRDASDDVSGAGKVYNASGDKSLNFCGNSEDTGDEVDIRITGSDARIQLVSGLSGPMFDVNEQTVGIGSRADQPVVQVSDNATLILNNVFIAHILEAPAQNANGIVCKDATVSSTGPVGLLNNEAERGGGIYAEDCTLTFASSNITFFENKAKEGGAIYASNTTIDHGRSGLSASGNSADKGAAFLLTNGSVSTINVGNALVSGNTVGDNDSAAVHVSDNSELNWTANPSASILFSKNLYTDDNGMAFRDIRVEGGSSVNIGGAAFDPGQAGQVQTEQNEYATPATSPFDFTCDDDTCTGLVP